MLGRGLAGVVVVVVLVASAQAHEAFLGDCPSVPSVKDFNMERFEGLWYVVESFESREECVTWNISRGEEKGTWQLRESKKSGVLHSVGLSDSVFTTAKLTPDTIDMARMTASWPTNILGKYPLTVHMTDYDNVAGVFLCQEIAIMQRQNGIILSRTPILKVNLKQMARLNVPGVKVEYYTPVRQYNCNRPQEGIQHGAGSSDLGPLGGASLTSHDDDDDNGGYDGFSGDMGDHVVDAGTP